MLKHFLLILTFFSLCLNASDTVEIYASSLETKDGVVTVDGGVTVVYLDYFLNAQRAVYTKESGDLELFDNIKVSHKNNYKVIGNYAKINLAKKERLFKPFYLLEKSTNVWISGGEGSAKAEDIDISSGIMSGCDQNNPLWKMQFASSDYNSKTKWLNIYDTTLYLYDLPVFYTPYFGYSLDDNRRTGLLVPTFGLSSSEGFFYKQPIYIAEYDWWDLEFNPQIRTNRGLGIYTDFRFVDSPISKGSFTYGFFREYDSYFTENNLKNNTHYGFNFNYDNRDVLNQWLGTNLQGQSGLYIDVNSMNDVDYINLKTNDTVNTNTATQVLSRANLFYNTNKNYYATYFKYYEDLTVYDNDSTLQQLPTFQYHKYLTTFFEDHLFYNIDLKSTNYTRLENKTAIQTDLNIPVKLQTFILDDFVNISYTANLYGQQSTFMASEEIPVAGVDYNDGYFARYYNSVSASTQLTRAFEDLTHVVSFESTYTHGGLETQGGYYTNHEETCADPDNQDEAQCEFYNISNIDNALELDMNQYLYDESGKEIIYHRLAQRIEYISDESQYGELENELDFKLIDGVSLYNNMFYNFDENKFSKVFNKISVKNKSTSLSLSHMYKNDFLEETNTYSPFTSYITSSVSYTYNDHYSYKAQYDYDIESHLTKSAEIGFLYTKRCWDFGIRYVENNRPVLTDNGESSIYDKYLYFTIVLKPFMKSSDSGSTDFGLKLSDS